MRVHRFYINPDESSKLTHDFWLHDPALIHQWGRVLRFAPGQEVVLFDGVDRERLYKLREINDREAHLQLVTDYVRQTPAIEIYLFWALLKKDKNDWVLQKCTELGVSHFIPILADHCVRSDLAQTRMERAQKIVIEAAEQCGRSDIPAVREPMSVETAITDYKDQITLCVAEQSAEQSQESRVKTQELNQSSHDSNLVTPDSYALGVMIGPEGGWSEQEKELFKQYGLKQLNLHDFTLRAETAAITAASQLIK